MRFKVVLCGVLAAALAASAFSQTVVRSSGGYGANSKYNLLYKKGSVVEISGKVNGVQRSAPLQGMEPSVSLLVKSGNGGTSLVDLGPAWYIDQRKSKFKLGDRVKVKGSKVMVDGRSTLLAQKVTKNNQVLYLRGEDGWPMWVAYRGHIDVASNASVRGNQVINGTISDIRTIPVGQSGGPSTVLIVTNGNGGIFQLDVGPVWFVDRQDMFLEIGNTIIVTGSPVNNGFFNVIDLRRGSDAFFMRDAFGRPIWQGFVPINVGGTGRRGG